MSGRLRCSSFHSVKGGVGKSTLSALFAVWLARSRSDIPVYLVDMDLTGTSLADVLPIEPPRWDGLAANAPIDLRTPPSDFYLRSDVPALLAAREDRTERAQVVGVPFLNDYLLLATPDWDAQKDAPVASVCWRLAGGPENLRVLPSSALPVDLERTLPVIYDEEHAAFLEARLEHLLDALIPDEGEVPVIFDTPPTIPGLSRSVLSLASRLSRTPKVPLEEGDGYIPFRLRHVPLDWKAFLVATLDYQDLRAAERWLVLDKRGVITPLLNRVPQGNPQQIEGLIQDALQDSANPRLQAAIPIQEDPGMQFFRGEKIPPDLDDLMKLIEGGR